MANLTFFEKPGCITNNKQKRLLKIAGVDFSTKNLLTEQWSEDRLRPFFSSLPIDQWINPNAPQVKSGEFDTNGLTEEMALAAMIETPLLIRRPLFEVGDVCWCGFDWDKICQHTNILKENIQTSEIPENCSQTDIHSECP